MDIRHTGLELLRLVWGFEKGGPFDLPSTLVPTVLFEFWVLDMKQEDVATISFHVVADFVQVKA